MMVCFVGVLDLLIDLDLIDMLADVHEGNPHQAHNGNDSAQIASLKIKGFVGTVFDDLMFVQRLPQSASSSA